jgi:hypothetical protein
MEPAPKGNITLISSPIPMITFNGRLTSQLSACPQADDNNYQRRDCYESRLFWMPYNLQTSVACNSITYAINQARNSCPPHVLANVLHIPALGPGNRLFPKSDGCTIVSQYSQRDACNQEYSSIHELMDIHEPYDDLPTDLPTAKWCSACEFMQIIDGRPLTDTNYMTNPAKTCTVDLIQSAMLNPSFVNPISWIEDLLKSGIELYFFPPPTDSRDMCATIPTLLFSNAGNNSQLASSLPKGHSGPERSVITMGKTMYEGTVYMRFKTIGVLMQEMVTYPNSAIVHKISGLHDEVWAEVLQENLYTMRLPDMNMGELYRSYHANLGVGIHDISYRNINMLTDVDRIWLSRIHIQP